MSLSDSPKIYTDSTAKTLRLALQNYFLLVANDIPPLKHLTNLLNTCFWASLKTEEAQQARIARGCKLSVALNAAINQKEKADNKRMLLSALPPAQSKRWSYSFFDKSRAR